VKREVLRWFKYLIQDKPSGTTSEVKPGEYKVGVEKFVGG